MARKKTKREPREPKAMVVGDVARAYSLIRNKRDGNLWHLQKLTIKNDRVVSVETSVENGRAMILDQIEEDILRDA